MREIGLTIQFIEDNLFEDINLDDLEQTIGYSKFYLSRLFRANTGFSVNEYITKRRLTEAVLLFEDLSILDAALTVGFSNDKYFSRVFKKNFGIPPSKYKSGNRFINLVSRLEVGEKNMIKTTEKNILKVLTICSSTKEIIKAVSSMEETIIDKVTSEFISILFVEEVDNQFKILKHMRYNPITQASTSYIIYDAVPNEGITIANLSVNEDVIDFEFKCDGKISQARLKKVTDYKLQCNTRIEGEK